MYQLYNLILLDLFIFPMILDFHISYLFSSRRFWFPLEDSHFSSVYPPYFLYLMPVLFASSIRFNWI